MKRFINLSTYAEFAYRGQQARTVRPEVSVLLTKPKLHREKVALEIDNRHSKSASTNNSQEVPNNQSVTVLHNKMVEQRLTVANF